MIRGADLSIVVQGALLLDGAVQAAANCEHWRALFPDAQIVLAVSVSDLLADTRPGPARSARLTPKAQASPLARAAVTSLFESCDVVVLAQRALPLPRFKEDAGLNNFNLQLAAAKAGLAQASRSYVLRTRADLVFLSRDFLELYEQDAPRRRGDAAVLKQRVMISPIFTLDPFSVERMPLHHSDWFHLGLLSDVRRLWDIPPIPLADAAFYRVAPHLVDSTHHERLFLTRLAVEQHLMLRAFKGSFPDLVLERHNDRRSLRLSLKILRDNFVVSDLRSCACLFEKYAADIAFEGNLHSCTTRGDWIAMCEAPLDQVDLPLRRKFARCPPHRASVVASANFRAGQLLSGQRLQADDRLTSPSGTFVLALDAERGLHLHAAGDPQTTLWRADVVARARDLRMQADGNLVLYDDDDTPLWASDTAGDETACLEVTDEGRLELWNGMERAWSSALEPAPAAQPPRGAGRLVQGARLQPGEALVSPAGRQELRIDANGALEVRDIGSGVTRRSSPSGAPGHAECLAMQDDGNLVAYALGGGVLWASDTAGTVGVHLEVNDDGRVALCCGMQLVREFALAAPCDAPAPVARSAAAKPPLPSRARAGAAVPAQVRFNGAG